MKTLIFAITLVFLLGCTYTTRSPKAIGYLIVEEIVDSENVLGELESIAMKFNYTISSSQDIALGKPYVVLKRRQYESANASWRYYASEHHYWPLHNTEYTHHASHHAEIVPHV